MLNDPQRYTILFSYAIIILPSLSISGIIKDRKVTKYYKFMFEIYMQHFVKNADADLYYQNNKKSA
jgi:hypothetical protein